MSTSSENVSIWATRDRILIGRGPTDRIDPGIGPNRYQRALDELQASGREVALASFTFDVEEPGSVIEIPTRVEAISPSFLSSSNGHVDGSIVSTGFDGWRAGLEGALATISRNQAEKVVLTRQVDLQFDSEVDVRSVAARLVAAEPDCFTFAVDGLVGASPELLVSLRNGSVTSIALAGTAVDSGALSSDKMDREHSLSQSSVEEGLIVHVEDLEVDDRTIFEFGEIKHLATKFHGKAVPGTTVLDMLASLHPTAAVAGMPRDAAIEAIRDLEPKSRGRYAGPVGWFDASGEGEFAIALRCGLLKGDKATLYAGGGIVEGSDAESEFAETELKLAPMMRALRID